MVRITSNARTVRRRLRGRCFRPLQDLKQPGGHAAHPAQSLLSSFRAPGAAPGPARRGVSQPSMTARMYCPVPPTSRKASSGANFLDRIALADWNCARLQVSSGVTRSIRWWGTRRRSAGRAWPCRYPCPGRTAVVGGDDLAIQALGDLDGRLRFPYSGGAGMTTRFSPHPRPLSHQGRGVLRPSIAPARRGSFVPFPLPWWRGPVKTTGGRGWVRRSVLIPQPYRSPEGFISVRAFSK